MILVVIDICFGLCFQSLIRKHLLHLHIAGKKTTNNVWIWASVTKISSSQNVSSECLHCVKQTTALGEWPSQTGGRCSLGVLNVLNRIQFYSVASKDRDFFYINSVKFYSKLSFKLQVVTWRLFVLRTRRNLYRQKFDLTVKSSMFLNRLRQWLKVFNLCSTVC